MSNRGGIRVLVMGAGCMGSVVGGFLANAGHEVTLVGRDAHMNAIDREGLRISGIWEDHIVRSLVTRTTTEGVHAGQFDIVLLTVKSYDTARAVEALKPIVDERTLVCSYQNGLGNAEIVAEAFGWERTIGARAIFGVVMREPGWVEVTVIANPTAIGVYSDQTSPARVRALVKAMDSSGVPTEYTDNIATVLWAKVAYNCALNPLSALLDVPYGALVDTEHTKQIMSEVVGELYEVGNAMQVALRPAAPEKYLELLYEKLVPPTAAHYASMHEDFRHKHRTEIDALNGAIVRYGLEHAIACPTNATLTRLVHAREHALGVRYGK